MIVEKQDELIISTLKLMVRGAYDLQKLRIQMGLRLCANFRAKLKKKGLLPDPASTAQVAEDGGEGLSKEAEEIIDKIRHSYKTLTSGIARNRNLPAKEGFKGDELISSYSELVLVNQFIQMESQEASQFRQFISVIEQVPIYKHWLKDQVGIGPAMAALLITEFDIHVAERPSQFWMYAGLDVAGDGMGRSWRKEHLVPREYKSKKGKMETRNSITYSPWLKTKLVGVLGSSFLRTKSPWAKVFYDAKNRILTDPSRQKITLEEYKSKVVPTLNGGVNRVYWYPGRIKQHAIRVMVKMFLVEFWTKWRQIEGLPVVPSYAEGKLGMKHRGYPDEAAG